VIAGMKRVLMMALLLLTSIAFVTTVFAQTKPEAKTAAAPEKAPAPKKKAEKAEKAKTFKGDFVSMDAASKTIVAKDAKGEMTFDVAGVKKMSELKAGEKIMVSYSEKDSKMVAKIVVKQASKKESPKKEEAKPVEPAKK
jgi:Cu/Ag efflux protein CusF